MYVSGTPRSKYIYEIPKFMFENRFGMSEVCYIEYISARICEFMVKGSNYSLFTKQIEEH